MTDTTPQPPKISVYLDQPLIDRLKVIAEEAGLNVSAWVRMLIIRELKKEEGK